MSDSIDKAVFADLVKDNSRWFESFDPTPIGDSVLRDLVKTVVNYETCRAEASESLNRYLEAPTEREVQTITAGEVGTIEAADLVGGSNG